MGQDVRKVINLVGVALILGLMFRYSKDVASLISVTGTTVTGFYREVSLQNLPVQH